jgi:PAS domain S-box-containing protein
VLASFVPILDEQGGINQVLSIVQDITPRKTAEEALRESEMRLRIVAENTYDWEFWIGPDETFRYCSPSCLPLTGHAAEEFLAHPNLLREIIHPDDLAAYDDHECRVAVTQSDGELEFRIVRPDGDVRWVGHTCIAIFDAAGQPLGRRGSCRDITPRREAEAQRAAAHEALQDSEARYRLLIENQGEGVGVVDPDERFVLANPAADAIFGVPQGSLVGRSLLEFLTPEERAAIRQQTQHRRTGQASTYELEITQASGDRRWVLVTTTPNFGDRGEFVGTFGVFRDITDRKAAEAALEESEAKFRALAEMTASAILIVGADGGILYANPAAQALSEYSLAEMLGMSAWELIHPEDCVWVERLSEASLRGEQVSSRYRFRGVTHRGETRWIDFTSVLIYYQGVQALLCTAHDVTGLVLAQGAEREQRLLAEALRDMAAALAGPLGFEAMLGRILEVVERIAPSDASTILLIEEGVARVACHRGFEGRIAIDALRAVRLPVDRSANLKQMVETGMPYAIPETHGDPAWVDLPGTRWIRSQAGAPICVGGKTIGFLSLDSAQPGFFTQAHAERLQAFANQAGIALENARLLDETARRAAEFAALYDVTRDVSNLHDTQRTLVSIVEYARKLLHTKSAHIYLYDAKKDDLEMAVATDPDAPIGVRLDMGEGLAGRVAVTRQPMAVTEYQNWEGRSAKFTTSPHGSILQVPLLYGGDLVGTLGVSEIRSHVRSYTEDDVRLLGLLAGQAAAAIHNARLYQAMQEDLAERQRVQEELCRSETLYRLLAENSTDVIWKLDLQTLRFTYISPAVTRLRGLTVAEAMAEPLDQTMDPQSLAYVRAGLAERLAAFAAGDRGAADAVTLVRQPRKDGVWIDVEIATTLLTDEHGQRDSRRFARYLGAEAG